MLLVIDNYDSFTWNLVHYIGEAMEAACGAGAARAIKVVRNDAMTVDAIAAARPQAIVLSPGPGAPESAGVCLETITRLGADTPILGVCLGHQAIGQAYGGVVRRAEALMHGKTSPIRHRGLGVFEGLPSPLTATRYHSLIVERASLPDCLEVTAELEGGLVMGLRHKSHPVEGVQFHPESIASEHGRAMLNRFLERAEVIPSRRAAAS